MVHKSSPKRDAFGRALQLLWCMAEAGDHVPDKEWGVRELARLLHFSPTSVHQLLRMLHHYGLVQQNPRSEKYLIGMEFFRLALKLTSHFSIRNVGMPVMRELVAQCNETAFLGVYDPFGMEMMFVATVGSSHPLRYVIALNERFPVYAGASGFSIMAYLPKHEQEAIIERTALAPLTKNTFTDPAKLEKELAKVRANGYAISIGHRTPGAVAIAAPIWGPGNRVIGDLALSIPEPRFVSNTERKLAPLVITHAKRISEQLTDAAPR